MRLMNSYTPFGSVPIAFTDGPDGMIHAVLSGATLRFRPDDRTEGHFRCEAQSALTRRTPRAGR